MGWLATHHELYSFIIFSRNCFQIQSLKHKSSHYPGGMPPDSLARSFSSYWLSVIYKLCKLGHTNDIMKDPTLNLATLLDLFLDQCLARKVYMRKWYRRLAISYKILCMDFEILVFFVYFTIYFTNISFGLSLIIAHNTLINS